jgi:hypothetical protein
MLSCLDAMFVNMSSYCVFIIFHFYNSGVKMMEINPHHDDLSNHARDDSVHSHPLIVASSPHVVHPISVSEYKEFLSNAPSGECSIRYVKIVIDLSKRA